MHFGNAEWDFGKNWTLRQSMSVKLLQNYAEDIRIYCRNLAARWELHKYVTNKESSFWSLLQETVTFFLIACVLIGCTAHCLCIIPSDINVWLYPSQFMLKKWDFFIDCSIYYQLPVSQSLPYLAYSLVLFV